jgi:hypothetical protein
MSRAPAALKGPTQMREPSEVWFTPVSKNNLDKAWQEVIARKSDGPASPANPYLFDSERGLGALARAVLLKDVFRSQIYRDAQMQGREYKPKALHFNIAHRSHADRMFENKALGPNQADWLTTSDNALKTLLSQEWRQSLCSGFVIPGEGRVAGLNAWFGGNYRQMSHIEQMTGERLFDSRFHGPAAMDNFLRFVLTGAYAPGSNTSLLQRQFLAGGRLAPHAGRRLEHMAPDVRGAVTKVAEVLRQPNNEGRPIVVMKRLGAPAFMTAVTSLVVDELSGSSKNICYVPIHRQIGNFGAGDAGYVALVEVLHRFTLGHSNIECDPGKVLNELEVKRKVAEIRAYCSRTTNIFIFDGYRHSLRPYPALADFISDEPLSRLLRTLIHPDVGAGGLPKPMRASFGTFFLIVGDECPVWASSHLQEEVSVPFDVKEKIAFATRAASQHLAAIASRQPERAPSLSGPVEAILARIAMRESNVVAENYLEAVAFMLLELGDVALERVGRPESGLEIDDLIFREYWSTFDANPWQRTFLRCLALSQSGIRFGSAGQLLDAYARYKANDAECCEEQAPVSADVFRSFVEETSRAGAGIVNCYWHNGREDATEPTSHPSLTIGSWVGINNWKAVIRVSANRKNRIGEHSSFSIRSRTLRRKILASTDRQERMILCRIIAELCLQSYRIYCIERPPEARGGRRAKRWLAEVLYYGVNSLEPPAPAGVPEAPRLPNYTLGEIPAHPIAALSFLYFGVFRDLMCEGRITSLGRNNGYGDLEIELLRFFGAPSLSSGEELMAGHGASDWIPSSVIGVLLSHEETTLAAGSRFQSPAALAKSTVAEHLLAYARAARRANRPVLLDESLRALERYFGDGMSPAQRLAAAKFKLDQLLMTTAAGERAVVPGPEFAHACDLIAGLISREGGTSGVGRPLFKIVSRLFVSNGRYFERCRKTNRTIDPSEMDSCIGTAVEQLEAQVGSLGQLPADALAILARAALFCGQWAASAVRARKFALALKVAGGTLGLFWLLKMVGATRQRQNPFCSPARVGSHVAEGYMALTEGCSEIFRAFPTWSAKDKHTERLDRRLSRSARSTLDTFLREQAGDHTDHIVALILEAGYLRHHGPRAERLVRIEDKYLPLGDMRLVPLIECFRWLNMAEAEMLEFTARPLLRIMFCEERTACAVEILKRARLMNVHRASIKVPEVASVDLGAVLDVLAHDLRQLVRLTDFTQERAPTAKATVFLWKHALWRLVRLVEEELAKWPSAADSWAGSHDELMLALQAACNFLGLGGAGMPPATPSQYPRIKRRRFK